MEGFIAILKSDISIIISYMILIILLIILIKNQIEFNKHKKEYVTFLKNIGNGKNVQKTLEEHMKNVQKVEKINEEIIRYCEQLDQKYDHVLQKVGMVRYNAFQDVGSDLSFALAILNNENTGIVLNGIYARDMSNIYAKPIEKGNSKYTLTKEEKEAIQKAIEA